MENYLIWKSLDKVNLTMILNLKPNFSFFTLKSIQLNDLKMKTNEQCMKEQHQYYSLNLDYPL